MATGSSSALPATAARYYFYLAVVQQSLEHRSWGPRPMQRTLGASRPSYAPVSDGTMGPPILPPSRTRICSWRRSSRGGIPPASMDGLPFSAGLGRPVGTARWLLPRRYWLAIGPGLMPRFPQKPRKNPRRSGVLDVTLLASGFGTNLREKRPRQGGPSFSLGGPTRPTCSPDPARGPLAESRSRPERSQVSDANPGPVFVTRKPRR